MALQPKAIVLGGHLPHIVLVDNLKKRGYYTILLDYAENPPAKGAADEHIIASSLDLEAVLAIAQDFGAKLVIATCSDQANLTACYVAEKLDLPAPYSYQTALNVTNKGLMKKIMLENSIPSSKHVYLESLESGLAAISDLKFPIVIKPVDGYGSKGVLKVDNPDEVEDKIGIAMSSSRSKRIVVEEYYIGKEIQADYFVNDGKAVPVLIREKQKITDSSKDVLQAYGSIIPAEISPKALENLHSIADKIVHSFKLNYTPLLIQAIVNQDDVKVIEFSPRIGGGLSYRMINMITGFDIVDASINSFLGVPTNIKVEKPSRYFASVFLYALPGQFQCIRGQEKLLKRGIIDEFFVLKNVGARVGDSMSSGNRVGGALLSSKNKKDLLLKIAETLSGLEVYDVNENPIMNRDIYHIK